ETKFLLSEDIGDVIIFDIVKTLYLSLYLYLYSKFSRKYPKVTLIIVYVCILFQVHFSRVLISIKASFSIFKAKNFKPPAEYMNAIFPLLNKVGFPIKNIIITDNSTI